MKRKARSICFSTPEWSAIARRARELSLSKGALVRQAVAILLGSAKAAKEVQP
jgi:hypothetical protein